MRVGMLAERLASAGHDVTWWTSTFDHVAKLQRFSEDSTERVAGNYRIELLHAPGYASNHSLARVRHHRYSAAAFARRAAGAIAPDLVYCCIPTLEVTEAALGYATALGIPTVVDVRDLWPDVYLRPVIATARSMLERDDRRAQFVFAGDGEGALEWRTRAAGLSNVVFTGWLSAAGIAALLEMSSVGLGAYAAGAPQGLPNKLYEYLSAGVPILSSLRGEAEALLAGAGCGVTYSARDPGSFAA